MLDLFNGFWWPGHSPFFSKQKSQLRNKIILEVLIEKGSAAVNCDANRTKTVCRTVEHTNFFLKVNNIEL